MDDNNTRRPDGNAPNSAPINASINEPNNASNSAPINEQVNEPRIVDFDGAASDGQKKCPKCGSTDISFNQNTGLLRCNFCRHEYEPGKVNEAATDAKSLNGQVFGLGAQDINANMDNVMTFKCGSCGAEVVIDTNEAMQARCHWCRNTLSINQQIPNGSVPDMVLPFSVKKEDAEYEIKRFVGKRKFFAHPKFKKEFTTDNIMGVYLPYMVIDINGHANMIGEGERLIRKYYVGSGDDREARYDADVYSVEREFDIFIDDLTIESSSDKLDTTSNKTNNILNSVMPFDTENCVEWDANYLRGITSEKRDTNVEQLRDLAFAQSKDIARHTANESLVEYDRGVCWANEQFNIDGQLWKSAYLPLWLYSYQQTKRGGKSLLHYVAVNARTKETMGSVPLHIPKLFILSAVIGLFGIIAAIIAFLFTDVDESWILALAGPLFFIAFYFKYRNTDARHSHEKETRTITDNLRRSDTFLQRRLGLSNSKIYGANNMEVTNRNGDKMKSLLKSYLSIK